MMFYKGEKEPKKKTKTNYVKFSKLYTRLDWDLKQKMQNC